uniref:Uncharacterized protein LOC114331932 n=1 Tax=Diabrotica virgifera virgifera TaxID=50390 RepID=A0A6P7FMD7_DIAVI
MIGKRYIIISLIFYVRIDKVFFIADLFNVPTSEQTYISPTSPDISSTFEPENIEQESEENSACENETEENSVCADETEKNRVCEKDTTDALQCTFGSNTIDQEESAEENSLYEKDTTDALRCTFGSNTIELEESAEENSVCKTDMSQSIKSSTKTAGSAIIRRILKDFSIETADSIQNTLISTRTTKNNRWHSSTPTDLNSSTSADDATSSTTVSTNVMTEDSTTQKEKAAVTKTVTRRNGHIEHNNNDVNKDPLKNMFNKQLNVNLTRLDLQQEKSGDKILFTSKSKLNKFEEKSNIKFKALTKEDGLDDGLTGDLGKISNRSDMSIIFDLFEESSSHKPNNNTNVESEGVISNSDVDQGCNKDTAKSIVSPENDDFNRYLCDLREHGNRTPSIPARKSQEKQEEEVPTKKRKICFAEKLVVATAGSADKMYPKSYKHQGVLKKLKRKWRIPPNIMTSQSFSDYGIQPTDPLLQAESFVVVNKLSDEEIDKWLRGKTCDDTKMKKTERTDLKATVLLRVDYDKETKFKGVCKGDRVLYNDGSHRKLPELINEGTVDSKTDDLIQPICESICCSKLLLEFKKLRICKTSDVPKISSNPFSFKISEKEKTDNNHRLLFIDRSSVNKVAEKIATISTSAPDSLDIVQQPAIVPEVEEFEKTMGKEEVAKVSTIPSDLHNLNLRKFSPSPVMNCFSPHSPNYSYFSDNSNFAEKSDSFQESDDIDIENNLILDNQELVEKKEEAQENQDVPRNEEARKEVSEATVWIEIAEQCITEPSPSLETNEPIVWEKTIDTIISSQSDRLQNQSIIWVNPIENTVVTSESLRQNETINESLIWVKSVEDTVVSTQSVCESMMWIKPIETTVAPSHNDSVVWTKQSEDSIVTSVCQNQAINVWVEPIKETSIPNSVTWVKAADSTVTICPINEPSHWDNQVDNTIDNSSTISSNAPVYVKAAEDIVCAKQAMPESTTETTITSESTSQNQLTDKPVVWIKPLVETIDSSQTVTSSQPINESMVWHETVEPICQNQPNDPVIWIKTMAEAVDTPQTVTSTQPTTDSMVWIKPSDETVVTTVSQAQPIAWIKPIENTVDTAQRSNQSMEWAKPTEKTSQTVCSNQSINESLVWAKSTEETVVSPQPIPDQTMNELLVWIKPMKDRTTECESAVKSQQSNCSYQDVEIKTDANSNIEEYTRLPLKKRKRSVNKGNELDEEIIAPEMMEEILKRARAEKVEKVDISYPATPAISIAEIQETLDPPPRTFKTPAQKKEMPPAPIPTTSHPQQKIITEQYNNHTYNNPTINYHMNNVPYPFFPCPSLSYFPSILVPVNGTTTFDVNVMNTQQAHSAQPMTTAHQEPAPKVKKEKRGRRRKKD